MATIFCEVFCFTMASPSIFCGAVGRMMVRVKKNAQCKRNGVNLRIQLMRLKEAKDRLQHYISDAKKNGKEVITRDNEKKWLERVNKTLEEGNEVLANLKSWSFQLSHKAMTLAEHASSLKSDFNIYCFHSSFGETMKAMEDVSCQTIGIWGLCGVGITTLAERVASEAKEDKLFDVMLMITVPPNSEEKQIQQLLADGLGLKFIENDTMEKRAIQLYERIWKQDRILVILDHIQDEVNLENLGLPIGDDHKGCKILLTSKTYDVLTWKLGAQKVVQVDRLSKEEAGDLVAKMVGDIIAQDSDMQSTTGVIIQELNMWGTSVLIAPFLKALRNKHVSDWKHALLHLRNDIRSLNVTSQAKFLMSRHLYKINEIAGQEEDFHKIICSISMLCYNHLKSEQAKLLFLLIGWIGSSYVSKYHLFLLSMGFGLFNQVDTLEDGRNKLQELIDELKDACLLIEDQEDTIKMHGIIRAGVVGILCMPELDTFFQKIGPKIKEWPDQSCHLIFMPFSHLSYLPKRTNTQKLQVLIMGLDYNMNFLEIPKSYFEKMEKLKVLHLRGNFVFPSVLPSLDSLKSLIVLSLFGCHLTDATIFTQLTNLEVLSFNGSNIQLLTSEFRQLHHLRLLDLENSSIREISHGVLSNLKSLEELYVGSTNICWGIEDKNNESTLASLNELGALNHLTNLDITVRDVQAWPIGLLFKCQLKFRILIGDLWPWDGKDTFQTLKVQQYKDIHLDQGMKALLKVVEHLVLNETLGFKNILCDLNAEGLPQLKYLNIQNNTELVFIIDSMSKVHSHIAFPNLISLALQDLSNLECICNGPSAMDSFCKLKIVKVACCHRIKNLLSFSMIKIIPQLVEIEVSECKSMEEILLLDEENANQQGSHIEFSYLQSLLVHNLPMLIGFCSKEMKSSMSQRSSDKKMETQILNEINEEHSSIPFFNGKVGFPKLETLHLSSLDFGNIWGDQLFGATSITQNLTKLTIEELNGLKHLFLVSMLKCLLKLRHLEIKNCAMMEEIFAMDEVTEETNKHMRDDSNEKIFFPNLKTMILHSMENLMNMWHSQLATPYSFFKLKTIEIKNCLKLVSIFPPYILRNLNSLRDLTVDSCNFLEDIVNLSELAAEKSMVAFDEQIEQGQPYKSVLRDMICLIKKACCMGKKD